jgi:hypothetical protein
MIWSDPICYIDTIGGAEHYSRFVSLAALGFLVLDLD